jgi:hypothetical protein
LKSRRLSRQILPTTVLGPASNALTAHNLTTLKSPAPSFRHHNAIKITSLKLFQLRN